MKTIIFIFAAILISSCGLDTSFNNIQFDADPDGSVDAGGDN